MAERQILGKPPVIQPGRGVRRLDTSGFQQGANLAGKGVGAVGEGVKGVVQVRERMQDRREGLARDSDDTSYAEQLNDIVRDLEKTADFSEPETIDQAIQQAEQLKAQILSNHKGGSMSRTMLEDRLNRRRVGFTDIMAVKNIEAARGRQKDKFDLRNRAITAQILGDPDLLLNPDLGEVFRKYDEGLEDEINFLGITSPSQKKVFRDLGRQNIAESMLTPLIQDAQFERAKAFLSDPAIEEVLDSDIRRKMAGRIIKAEQGLDSAEREGEHALNLARHVLGPNASDEDIRAAAGELAGISKSQDMEFFKLGNDVIGINKNTNTIAVRIEGPTVEEEAARAGAVEKAKLMAKMGVLSDLLGRAGAEPLPTEEDGSEGAAITAPFDTEGASEDARAVARLFTTSRRLLLVGEKGMADGLLSQARFIAENSPEIQRQRELDKPLSPTFASEMGVEIGTTMRDVLGQIPPSPGELAQERGAGAARGREQIAGEEQIAFIDEARTMIGDLLEEIEVDPGVVAIRGSLRATGQTALGVIGDLGFDAIVDTARDMAFENTELGLDSAANMFDSETLSVLDILENSIGMILARLRTPTGRIPVDVIKRSISDVGLTGLKGSKQVENRLNFVLDQLNRRAKAISRRFGLPGEKPEEKSNIPRFKIEGNTVVPVE